MFLPRACCRWRRLPSLFLSEHAFRRCRDCLRQVQCRQRERHYVLAKNRRRHCADCWSMRCMLARFHLLSDQRCRGDMKLDMRKSMIECALHSKWNLQTGSDATKRHHQLSLSKSSVIEMLTICNVKATAMTCMAQWRSGGSHMVCPNQQLPVLTIKLHTPVGTVM